jgi:hypothetical protein
MEAVMRSRRNSTGLLVGLAVVGAASLAGCGATPAEPESSGAPTVAPTTAAPTVVPPSGSRDAWLVVGRRGEAGVEVILASTAETLFELPPGVPDETWGHQLTATTDGTRTTITNLAVQPGFGGWETVIDGAWHLPTVGLEPMPAGVSANVAESPNKATIVLVEDVPGGAPGTTRFAVVRRESTTGGATSSVIELPGSFDYDAISPDGSRLYVVEHLAGEPEHRYQVRVVDVATGVLSDKIITDKRTIGQAMAGWPIAQLRRPDGMVFTLYRGAEHPFIHALNTVEAWAVCIDLPAVRHDDEIAALDWGLAATPDGRAVFAVNATLGQAVEVDPGELVVRRSAAIDPLGAGSSFSLAKFGHIEGGPVGRRVVVAPDGRTLHAAGSDGIVAIDTARLAGSARFLGGTGVSSLGIMPDGRTLYAMESTGGVVALDTASGEIVGRVPAEGFDRLLAVMPS